MFPGLANFECSGKITSILFIAERNSTAEATASITFSLWQPINEERPRESFFAQFQGSYEVAAEDVEMVSEKGDIAIYQASLKSPLQFQIGDIVGIDNSSAQFAIQYAYGWGPENYVLASGPDMSDSGKVVATFTSGPVAVQDFPLFAMLYTCESCKSML